MYIFLLVLIFRRGLGDSAILDLVIAINLLALRGFIKV